MKYRNYIVFVLVGITVLTIFLFRMEKSYSYGLTFDIVGSPGKRELIYYDADSNQQISVDTAVEFYGAYQYMEMILSSGNIYFYRGREITKNEYIRGYDAECADKRAKKYGKSAYRVHNTSEFKKAFDDIYRNMKIGKFYIEFSKYENIDFDEVDRYFKEKYGLLDPYQDYYSYSVKGPLEPTRFGIGITSSKEEGELLIDSFNIRITGDELQVTNAFLNKLIPLMQGDGSDYQKILAAYTYITQRTSYLTDNGFSNDFLASNTSIYDVFINRKSVCIGYSIAFSYLMDKMGIESYIVDDIYDVNEFQQTFSSSHTYNIVKLNNKFYRIDLTGKQFLTGISNGLLYDNKLPISTTKYNTSGKPTTYNFDYKKIDTYLNEAKKSKTTTTTKANTTTTLGRTTRISTTTKKTTTEKITTSNSGGIVNQPETTTTTTTTSNAGYNPGYTTTTDAGYIKGEPTSRTTTKKKELYQPNLDFNINLNYILFGLGGLVIVLYVIYKIKNRRRKNYDDDITDILNQHYKR